MKLQQGDPVDVGMSAERLKNIVPRAESWIKPGLHQCIVMLAARRGQIVFHGALGSLTPESDSRPVQLDSIYPMCSLTKMITATAIMILVDEGFISLNRPVVEYIPEFIGEGKERVMVSNLLTHSWGVRDEELDAYINKKMESGIEISPVPDGQHPTIHKYLFLGYDVPLVKPPGTLNGYCNYGYELLGEIVRRVSGKPSPQFAMERIITPLSMKDTNFFVPKADRVRIVKRPLDAPSAIIESMFAGIETEAFFETPWALGGAYSTVMDAAIFGQMFLNGGCYGDVRILSPAAVASMTRDQIPGVGFWGGDDNTHAGSWSHGWEIRGGKKGIPYGSLHTPSTYGHSGAGGLLVWIDPEFEILGVYFSVELDVRDNEERMWCADLFVNMVTAAVEVV